VDQWRSTVGAIPGRPARSRSNRPLSPQRRSRGRSAHRHRPGESRVPRDRAGGRSDPDAMAPFLQRLALMMPGRWRARIRREPDERREVVLGEDVSGRAAPIPEITRKRLHAGAPWSRRARSRERCRPEGQVSRDRRQQRERPKQASSHGALPSRSGKAR